MEKGYRGTCKGCGKSVRPNGTYCLGTDCRKKYHAEYREKNRERENARIRKWYHENPDRAREYLVRGKPRRSVYLRKYYLKNRYGLTEDSYWRLLDLQKGRCPICLSEAPSPGSNETRWHVDHCHKTGRVRGILCCKCNLGLGNFGDDVMSLNRAIGYLTTQSEGKP